MVERRRQRWHARQCVDGGVHFVVSTVGIAMRDRRPTTTLGVAQQRDRLDIAATIGGGRQSSREYAGACGYTRLMREEYVAV